VRPVKPEPIRLGSHCCVCAVTCNHIGPIRLCQTHWLEGKDVRFPDDGLVSDRRNAQTITLDQYLEMTASR
jgi:hypothetical protein